MSNQIIKTMMKIVAMLVAGDFRAIESISGGNRLSADEIKAAVAGYPGCLIMPPADAFQWLDIVEIENSIPPKWSVVIRLWTDIEGESDLSLETTLTETKNDLCVVELDDLHVR